MFPSASAAHVSLTPLFCLPQELQAAFAPGSHFSDGTWKIVFMDVEKKLGVLRARTFAPRNCYLCRHALNSACLDCT